MEMTDVPNEFAEGIPNLPILPPKPTIAFRCRDCELVWTFGSEGPVVFERFYQKNRECPSCGNSNIEVDVISQMMPPGHPG